MNFIEIAKKRYAVRDYQSKPVEAEKLEKILEAARIAPTGGNCQPQKLLVIQKAEGLKKISKAANIYGAPLAIIVCGDKNKVWTRPFDGKNLLNIDTTIVTDHMMLAATELGLGTVWVCYFEPTILKKEFQIPEHLEPINILVIGYAAGTPESPDRHHLTRNALSQIVSYETL